MSESRSSPKRIKAARRHKEFLDLRVAGMTYPAIADKMNVSTTRARQIVDEELDRVRAVTAEEAVTLKRRQLGEYQALKWAWWGRATGTSISNLPPDKDAANVVLKAMAQEARLAGLDSPTKAVTADLGPLGELTEAELDAELARHSNVFKGDSGS